MEGNVDVLCGKRCYCCFRLSFLFLLLLPEVLKALFDVVVVVKLHVVVSASALVALQVVRRQSRFAIAFSAK